VAPGQRAKYLLTIANHTDLDWPATTRVIVAGGAAGDLYDAQTWTSPTELGALDVAIPAGERGDLGLEIATPNVDEETPMSTTFAIVDASGAELATFDLAVTVTPMGNEGTSTDGDEDDVAPVDADEDGVESGGCNAGGGSAGAGLAFGVLALVARRRRPRA